MALSTRIQKLEDVLKPPGEILTVIKYSCMDERAMEAAIRHARGRQPQEADVIMVVILTDYTECPEGAHRHPLPDRAS